MCVYFIGSNIYHGTNLNAQGHIWRGGYATGGLTGEVYPDVLPALRRWTRMGKRVAIYSSGSREVRRHDIAHHGMRSIPSSDPVDGSLACALLANALAAGKELLALGNDVLLDVP